MTNKTEYQKKKTKKLYEAEMDKVLLNRPSYLEKKVSNKNQLLLGSPDNSKFPDGLMQFDEDGQPYLHENIGVGANQERHIAKLDLIQELELKYGDFWMKRGVAKQIAPIEGLAVRTIQNYQRYSKNKLKTQGQVHPKK